MFSNLEQFVIGYFVLISALTYFTYFIDKHKSMTRGAYRVPEATLHFLSLMGGSLAAFIAQRNFRHKTKKTSFQIVFWGIVFLQVSVASYISYLLFA